RPSPGLVPSWPSSAPWIGLSVKGPLARTVGDVALILTAIVGADPRDQLALPIAPDTFARPLDREFRGVPVAWRPDLGGVPLDPRVRSVLDAQRRVFTDLGCIVEEAVPDLTDANEIFLTLRAALSATGHEEDLRLHRDRMKPEAVWNTEEGFKLSAV